MLSARLVAMGGRNSAVKSPPQVTQVIQSPKAGLEQEHPLLFFYYARDAS